MSTLPRVLFFVVPPAAALALTLKEGYMCHDHQDGGFGGTSIQRTAPRISLSKAPFATQEAFRPLPSPGKSA